MGMCVLNSQLRGVQGPISVSYSLTCSFDKYSELPLRKQWLYHECWLAVQEILLLLYLLRAP